MHKSINGMILYHASYMQISEPDLKKCADFKDFGKGFYLTSSKEQAKNFISTSVKKAIARGVADKDQNYGFISKFRVSLSENETRFFEYTDADESWLHCVVGHRKPGSFSDVVRKMEKYDIISGKIADDATNFTIVAYISGAYGEIGSSVADNIYIGRLIPERLNEQYCFRTPQSLDHLEFIESEKIWIK